VTARFGWERAVHLTLTEPDETALQTAAGALARRAGAVATQPDPTRVTVTYDSREATAGELIRDLATALDVTDIRIEEPSAESIIRRLYEGDLMFESAT